MRFRSDTVVGFLLLALCGIAYLATLSVPKPNFGSVGAAFFPRVLLALLAPLSAVLFLKALISDLRVHEKFDVSGAGPAILDWVSRYRNVIVSFVVFFCFVYVMEIIGYMISGVLFLFAMQWYLGPRSRGKVLQHALVSVGVTLFLWAIFRWVLIVLLPEGEIF